MWDGKTGDLVHRLATQETPVSSLSFSPDGKLLLSGSGVGPGAHHPHVYDVASLRQIVAYAGHDSVVGAVAFSPDGRWAASAGGNDNASTSGTLIQVSVRLAGTSVRCGLGALENRSWPLVSSPMVRRLAGGARLRARMTCPLLIIAVLCNSLSLVALASRSAQRSDAASGKEGKRLSRRFGLCRRLFAAPSQGQRIRIQFLHRSCEQGEVRTTIALGATNGWGPTRTRSSPVETKLFRVMPLACLSLLTLPAR